MDFALNEEQQEFKDRCRTFAREVIRPAARKHDEEESTPWEVIKEARRQGFGPRGDPALGRRRRRPDAGDRRRRVPLGLRRHRAGDLRLGARRGRHRLLRHPRADRPLGARVLRHRRGDQARRLRGHRAAGRLRREEPEDDREARRRRVGPQRDQGLHHQRRHRRRPRRRRHRRPGARHPRPGLLRRRQGHPRPQPGQEGDEARHPRLAHRRGRPRGLPHPGREPARRRGEAGAEARARPLGPEVALRRRAGDLRDHPAAGRRLGARHRPGRLRVDPRVPGRPVRGRHAAAADAAHPADPRRRRDRDRSRPPAGPARRLDGPQRRPDDAAARARCRS